MPHKPKEEESDTVMIEKGLWALGKKILDNNRLYRSVVLVALSLIGVEHELPSKVDVTTPIINTPNLITKDDFHRVEQEVNEIKNTVQTLNNTTEDLKTKIAFMSGKLSLGEGYNARQK